MDLPEGLEKIILYAIVEDNHGKVLIGKENKFVHGRKGRTKEKPYFSYNLPRVIILPEEVQKDRYSLHIGMVKLKEQLGFPLEYKGVIRDNDEQEPGNGEKKQSPIKKYHEIAMFCKFMQKDSTHPLLAGPGRRYYSLIYVPREEAFTEKYIRDKRGARFHMPKILKEEYFKIK